jgi:catechol 2,3-dioxygenase-like lactoylglutathione lyase family enzyme
MSAIRSGLRFQKPALAALSFYATIFTGIAAGQASPAPITGVGTLLHAVDNLDRSITFYRDQLGMELNGSPESRPYNLADPVLNLYGVPTAKGRAGTLRVPGSPMGVELIEFKDIKREAVTPRIQDPGAATLILQVREIEPLLVKLEKAHVPMLTTGGQSIGIAEKGRNLGAAIVLDPDGFAIELIQTRPTPETNAPATSNIIGAGLRITIEDMDKAVALYSGKLGFEMTPSVRYPDDDLYWLNLWGMTQGVGLGSNPADRPRVRRMSSVIPGTSLPVEFLEFQNIRRAYLGSTMHDPGTIMIRLRLNDADTMAETLKAAGLSVVTTGGKPVLIPNAAGVGPRFAIMQDPNGIFLQLWQPPPAAQ